MTNPGFLDDIMKDLDDLGASLAKRRRISKEDLTKNSYPYSASVNYTRGELEYRDDDYTVAPVSIMDTNLTYDIPDATPAYLTLKKMATPQEKVHAFQTYWLHSSRFPTLDLKQASHMLAIFMVEFYRRKNNIDKLMRPFQSLANRFNATKGSGNVKGKQVKSLYIAMRDAIYPAAQNNAYMSTQDAHLEFYVREILVSERFYINILHVDMDRKKAQKVLNLCTGCAKSLMKKKPETASTYDYTVVRHAIAHVCDQEGFTFDYRPAKPSKKDAWLLHKF